MLMYKRKLLRAGNSIMMATPGFYGVDSFPHHNQASHSISNPCVHDRRGLPGLTNAGRLHRAWGSTIYLSEYEQL